MTKANGQHRHHFEIRGIENPMRNFKSTAVFAIAAGGALAGLFSGWHCGPLRLELDRELMALLGLAGGILVTLFACAAASEYSEARTRNQAYLNSLRRLGTSITRFRNSQHGTLILDRASGNSDGDGNVPHPDRPRRRTETAA